MAMRWYARGLLIGAAVAAGACGYSAQKRAAGWTIAETEHVRLQTTMGSERAAELVVELQRIRDTLAGKVLRCAFGPRADRVVVTVLSSTEYGDIAPPNVAAQYRKWGIPWVPEFEGQIVMPDEFDRATQQIYQHELTHHLVAACFPRAPVWLHEGMAKFLETMVVEEKHVLVGVPPYALLAGDVRPDSGVYRGVFVVVLPRDRLPSIAEVMAGSSRQFHATGAHDPMRAMTHYATSWALVHLFELGAPDLRERFGRFLGGLRRVDADPAALFAHEFQGIDVQRRLTDYVRRGQTPYVRLPAAPPRAIAPRVRPMREGEAHLEWAWLWAAEADREEPRARMAEHLSAASGDADSAARAHLLSAAMLVRSRKLGDALREVTRGLRAAPADPELLHAHVELLLQSGADPSDAAERLRKVARTGEQLCALAAVELSRSQPARALPLTVRGLAARPSSRSCRRYMDIAREGLRAMRAGQPNG